MPSLKLPTFFVVGAAKAGTTSLHRYLQQHPQIYMSPIKEPSYFASEIRAASLSPAFERRMSNSLISEWEDYLKLFENMNGQAAIGEATPSYLWSATAPGAIRLRIPDAKIVMILRDPAERAFSHYLHHRAEGLTRWTFREQIEQSLRNENRKFSILYPFLELGLYFQQVKRYLGLFPRENVRIYLYEEAWRRPQCLFRDLFEFLGVDAAFEPDTSRRSLERRAPRLPAVNALLKNDRMAAALWRSVPEPVRGPLRRVAFRWGRSIRMAPNDRRHLVGYYRADIEKLSALLDRDLSAWLG